MAVRLDRPVERHHDILGGRVGLHAGKVLREGFAGHGQAIAMQKAPIQEHLHQRGDPPDGGEVGHAVLAARFQVAEHRDIPPDPGEIVDRQLHLGGMGDGEKVKDGVGGSAERDDNGDGVFEGFPGHDVTRSDTALDQTKDGGAGIGAIGHLVPGDRQLGGAVGQAHAHGFDGRCHRVGGVHAAAGPGARDGTGLDCLQFVGVDFLVGVLADGFENGDNVDRLFAMDARQDGAAVDEDRRPVHPGHGDQAAGHVLVAAADGDETVEALRTGHGFDRVGDHFAGDQRIAHARGSHGNTVGYGDGAEDDRLARGGIDSPAGLARQLVDVHVAGSDHAPG